MEFRKASHVDVTEHNRTPAEESLYETYLLRKHSDVENLYSSNVYEGQCFNKAIKQLNKDRKVQVAEIDREMKKLHKRFNQLKTRSSTDKYLEFRRGTLPSAKEGRPTLPTLSPGRQRISSSRPVSRALSEVSSQSCKSGRTTPKLGTSMLKPAIHITVCESGEEGEKNNIKKSSDEDKNITSFKNSNDSVKVQKSKGNAFFVTEIKEMTTDLNAIQDFHLENDQILRKPSTDAPPQRSCRLSPVFNARIDVKQSLTPPKNAPLRTSKSHQSLLGLADSTNNVNFQRRPRSHTTSACTKTESRNDNQYLSYERVNRAFSVSLPKI